MADTTKVVPVEVGGREFNLKYTQRSWYKVDRETSRPLAELFEQLGRGSYSAMCDLFWAGIVHEHPKMQPEEVADFLAFDDAEHVVKAIQEALPDEMTEDPTEQPPADT